MAAAQPTSPEAPLVGETVIAEAPIAEATRECTSCECVVNALSLNKLRDAFGSRFLVFLVCAQHMSKGIVPGVSAVAWPYVMKEYSVPASRVSQYLGIRYLPWAMKPALGLVSDSYPIWGYTRLPYLLGASVVGVTALLLLTTLRTSLEVEMVVWLLFAVALYEATVDLLSEAIYTSKLRSNPGQTPYLVSFIWAGITIMGAVGTGTSGVILYFGGSPWPLYAICLVPASLILAPSVLNWAGEQRLNDREVEEQRDRVLSQKEAVFLALILVLATLVLMASGMLVDVRANAIISLVVALVVMVCFSVMLNPIIAKVNAFALIQTCLTISLESAGFYFCTDTKDEYKDGPHFTPLFYNTVLPLCGSAFSLLGIWCYSCSAHLWSYQKLYIIGNLVIGFISLLDVLFFLRWNKEVGINDHVFVLGSSSVGSLVNEWLWMPSIALLSQLCPKGMEAIMFANLAGCHNLGNTISQNFGALLLHQFGIEPRGDENEGSQFNNLWLAALITSGLPLLPVALVPWFIPNKLSTERILDREDMPSNEGSLLQAWLGKEEPKESDIGLQEGSSAGSVPTGPAASGSYGSIGQG